MKPAKAIADVFEVSAAISSLSSLASFLSFNVRLVPTAADPKPSSSVIYTVADGTPGFHWT
jgi:hypothetical protein